MAIPISLKPDFYPVVQAVDPDEEGHVKGFVIEKQDMTNWCWAEIAAGVYEFHESRSIERCKLVKDVFREALGVKINCCSYKNKCNKPLELSVVLGFTGNLGPGSIDGPASEQDVKAAIPPQGGGSPIVCGIDDKEKGGHAVAIVGWYRKGQDFSLLVADPLRGASPAPKGFKELTDDLGYKWLDTFFTQKGGKIL